MFQAGLDLCECDIEPVPYDTRTMLEPGFGGIRSSHAVHGACRTIEMNSSRKFLLRAMYITVPPIGNT